MANSVISLEGKNVLKVRLSESGILYKSGRRKEAGATYSIFQFNGKNFSVPDTSDFLRCVKERDLESVELIEKEYDKKVTTTKEDGTSVTTTEKDVTYELGDFVPLSISRKMQFEEKVHEVRMQSLAQVTTSGSISEEILKSVMSISL